MRETLVYIEDKGYEIDISEICPQCYDELVIGRSFPKMQDMQYMMMTLQRSKDAYAIAHAQICPADLQYVVSTIEALPKYK